ncbi:DUF5129 domain-containing protein [Corynebacterium qintianiae]|uniref:DUF5129 domain-containing protein n=1 Tax=Corynebacterium qintianiae TaxID=2709392 RepID=UPI002017B889|nr:DUF5129 domain-containing protein [Corynebacterium qintianiae]
MASQIDVPERDQFAVQTIGAPRVVINDPHDILAPGDEARMLESAERLSAPSTVKTLHWMVFDKSHDNVNDTVEEFMRDNYPDEIGNDKFADGVLIIGAGTEQRQVFSFAGEDVADQLHLREGERLESVNDAMKPGMRDNNIPAAMFAGANKAMNAQDIESYDHNSAVDDRIGASVGAGIGAGGIGLAGSSIAVAAANRRKKAIAQGREDYELVTREYAQLGQRLNEVDVRANSLTSAFADNEMRKQWAEVRDRFLGMHDTVSGAGGIGGIDMNDDKQVYSHRTQLASAAESIRHTSNAEDNINRLFKVENGDAAARRSDLTAIREDVMQARLGVTDPKLEAELAELEARINELDRNPEAPDFLDRFVRVLGDYRAILEVVKKKQFSDVKEHNELVRPTIYDTNYYYSGYVPYVALNSWHTSNVEAEQAAQSSSTNSSFSSGFSGAGGSSGY